MRALHVDAFFDYLLGKQHPYFTRFPPIDDPYPEHGRDGVPTEEDLALRALDPSLKPKRGRKRNEPPTPDARMGKMSAVDRSEDHNKRGFSAYPHSAFPRSAVPFSALPGTPHHDPWAEASARTVESGTPYPSSAINQTPSSARIRRSHGPSVSSAWPSTTTPGGKIRGRPPAGRSVVDGAFSTFPVRPTDSTGSLTMAGSDNDHRIGRSPAPAAPSPTSARERPDRERLQLRVPQYMGGAVRLMTPITHDSHNDRQGVAQQPVSSLAQPDQLALSQENGITMLSRQRFQDVTDLHTPALDVDTLKKALVASLLRSIVMGRETPLTGPEARQLCDLILTRAGLRHDTTAQSHSLEALASWLGLHQDIDVLHQSDSCLRWAQVVGKRIEARKFAVDNDGYDIPVAMGPGPASMDELEARHTQNGSQLKDVFDVYWSVVVGAITGNFSIRGLELR